MGIQSRSKKSFLESRTHWTQLWSATVENARVRVSSSSKVCPSAQETKHRDGGMVLVVMARASYRLEVT